MNSSFVSTYFNMRWWCSISFRSALVSEFFETQSLVYCTNRTKKKHLNRWCRMVAFFSFTPVSWHRQRLFYHSCRYRLRRIKRKYAYNNNRCVDERNSLLCKCISFVVWIFWSTAWIRIPEARCIISIFVCVETFFSQRCTDQTFESAIFILPIKQSGHKIDL